MVGVPEFSLSGAVQRDGGDAVGNGVLDLGEVHAERR
jgi:hypothetical protein